MCRLAFTLPLKLEYNVSFNNKQSKISARTYMMMIIRPIKMDDLEDIVTLASKTGAGLTTLPHNKAHLQTKIQDSLNAFDKIGGDLGDETYLFVLEESSTGKIVGISGIVAAVGTSKPFYTYKINTEVHYSQSTNIYKNLKFLTLTNDFTGAAEICTLFLSPDFRGSGNGQLLSKSRFLFMAQHPSRFGDDIVAEMRGVSDDEGHSPFWDNVGRHFFGMDFDVADKENGEGNSQFIAELVPHHPIYVDMLSKEAQATLGKVHPHTKPAEQMLEAEGLRNTGYIDIFDAGPTIVAPFNLVTSIKESEQLVVEISDVKMQQTQNAMISNTEIKGFRACLAKLALPTNGKVIISSEIASSLMIKAGEKVRVKFS